MRMRMFEIFHSQWSQGSFFNLRLQKSNSTGNKNHHQWQGRSELLVIRLIRFYVTLSVLKTAGCSGGFISPHLPHQVEIEFAQLLPVRTELSQEKLDNISTSLLSLQQYLHLHLHLLQFLISSSVMMLVSSVASKDGGCSLLGMTLW